MVLSPYNVEVLRGFTVTCLGALHMYGLRVPSGVPCIFPLGFWMSPLFISHCMQFHHSGTSKWPLFFSIGSLSLGLTNNCFIVLFPLK